MQSIKLKNKYIDSTGIVHNETLLSDYIDKFLEFPILRIKPSNNVSITANTYKTLPFDEIIENTASDYLEQNQEKTHIIAKKKCTIVIAGAFSTSSIANNGAQFGITYNHDGNLNSGVKLRSLFYAARQNSQVVVPATYINLNTGDYIAIPMYFPDAGGITVNSYINVAVVNK